MLPAVQSSGGAGYTQFATPAPARCQVLTSKLAVTMAWYRPCPLLRCLCPRPTPRPTGGVHRWRLKLWTTGIYLFEGCRAFQQAWGVSPAGCSLCCGSSLCRRFHCGCIDCAGKQALRRQGPFVCASAAAHAPDASLRGGPALEHLPP